MKNLRALIILSLILFSFQIAGAQKSQDKADEARQEICKRVPCRPATTLRLRLNEKEYYETEFPAGPYVAEGFINLLAGEAIFVELDEQDGKLSNPRYVKLVEKAERTLHIKFEQTTEGMILSIKNPFGKELVYDCRIQRYDEEQFRRTGVIPVPARLMSFEMWPYPITQVVISNLRFKS